MLIHISSFNDPFVGLQVDDNSLKLVLDRGIILKPCFANAEIISRLFWLSYL